MRFQRKSQYQIDSGRGARRDGASRDRRPRGGARAGRAATCSRADSVTTGGPGGGARLAVDRPAPRAPRRRRPRRRDRPLLRAARARRAPAIATITWSSGCTSDRDAELLGPARAPSRSTPSRGRRGARATAAASRRSPGSTCAIPTKSRPEPVRELDERGQLADVLLHHRDGEPHRRALAAGSAWIAAASRSTFRRTRSNVAPSRRYSNVSFVAPSNEMQTSPERRQDHRDHPVVEQRPVRVVLGADPVLVGELEHAVEALRHERLARDRELEAVDVGETRARAICSKASGSMCEPLTVLPSMYGRHIGHCRLHFIVVSIDANSGNGTRPSKTAEAAAAEDSGARGTTTRITLAPRAARSVLARETGAGPGAASRTPSPSVRGRLRGQRPRS